MVNGLLFTDISDHLPVFAINFTSTVSKVPSVHKVTIRDNSEKNLSNFNDQLKAIDWSFLGESSDPNSSYNSFLKVFSDTYDKCCPLKMIKRKRYLSHKPWLSKGLLKSIRSKNKLYKQFLRNPSVANEAHKNYKNKLNHSLRIAKKSFYEKKLSEVKSITRATWRLLNEILNRKTSKVKLVSTFKIDGKDISDPLTIANKFCEYFSNIGPSLAKGITSTSSHRAFLSGTFVQSIFLAPATKNEILTITNSFLTGKASGHDNLPVCY